ncbi:maleylpyruvate isomerase family mycothiol-dependent enzyme [Streptomyces gamaensis]|uniref:Maleylpyruvate isomerase family mycothiol-dependent enzyme n=1 Tax=Streptomyces gamaensis TaxID=1763542 RepID=A0ABW0YYB5_9ACTN
MEIAEHIEALDREGALLADAAVRAGLDAAVPTCPRWRVRELLSHTGRVHRWAARYVTESRTAPEPLPDDPGLDGGALVSWYRDGHRALVEALTAAEAGLECWTFLDAPSPRAFWARRQAHETTVHRADAEAALGAGLSPVDPGFAADGLDELLAFHALEAGKVRAAPPRTLRLRATDSGAVWTVRLSDAPPRVERTDRGAADCELSGTASELYLTAWNRLPQTSVTVAGDAAVARLWREPSAI